MRLLRLLLLTCSLFVISGCAELMQIAPKVISLVTDAMLVVQQIESVADGHFRAHPDAEKQAKVDRSLGRTRASLLAVQRATSSEERAAAQKDFRDSYDELLGSCAGIPGLRIGGADTDGAPPGPGEVVVPEPLLLVRTLE